MFTWHAGPLACGEFVPIRCCSQVRQADSAPNHAKTTRADGTFGMSFRSFVVFLLILFVGVGAVLWLRPDLLGSRTAAGLARAGFGDAPRYPFVESLNALGDRILLTTPAGITVAPQPTGPDRVTVAPASTAGRAGVLRFTIAPHMGRRGIRRAFAEVDMTGQVYRVCEVVDDPAGSAPVRAQRFQPINNSGDRTALPVAMPTEPWVALINAAIASAAGVSNGGSATPSAETQRLADALVGPCLGQ